jgi:transcriptional regulator
VYFDDSIDAARHAVGTLTVRMEGGCSTAWSPSEPGARYEAMLPAIVAFRAEVIAIMSKFKLGHNERAIEGIDPTMGSA